MGVSLRLMRLESNVYIVGTVSSDKTQSFPSRFIISRSSHLKNMPPDSIAIVVKQVSHENNNFRLYALITVIHQFLAMVFSLVTHFVLSA